MIGRQDCLNTRVPDQPGLHSKKPTLTTTTIVVIMSVKCLGREAYIADMRKQKPAPRAASGGSYTGSHLFIMVFEPALLLTHPSQLPITLQSSFSAPLAAYRPHSALAALRISDQDLKVNKVYLLHLYSFISF